MTNSSTIEIKPYAGEKIEDFVPLFQNYTFGRYCSDWELNIEASRKLELDRLYAYIQNNPASCRIAHRGDTLLGILAIRLSQWDTDFWGIRYAIIDHLISIEPNETLSEEVLEALVEEVDRWCQEEKIDLIMARVDVYDLSAMHALERHGFGYIETTITNTLNIKDMDATPSKDFVIRHANPEETERLVDFSLDAFNTHRFYAEKRFATEKVDVMYRQWVRNALNRPNIWTTLVLEKNDKVLGFMTYAIEDVREYFETSFVKLRMACLDKRERGKNHGVDLFNGVMQYTHSDADVIVSGLTIRNIHSFNLHTKLNYKLKCSTNTLHKWFS